MEKQIMQKIFILKYSESYTKTSASLWQYYKDVPDDNIPNHLNLNQVLQVILIMLV